MRISSPAFRKTIGSIFSQPAPHTNKIILPSDWINRKEMIMSLVSITRANKTLGVTRGQKKDGAILE